MGSLFRKEAEDTVEGKRGGERRKGAFYQDMQQEVIVRVCHLSATSDDVSWCGWASQLPVEVADC